MPEVRIVSGFAADAVDQVVARVVEMHAAYYEREWGFGRFFEDKVATELAAFLERFDEGRDGFWTAVADGRMEGSIAIDGGAAGDGSGGEGVGAHLRWFVVSDELRGQGVGGQLMEAAMGFCAGRGYDRVYLWTFEGLDAARHLYEKHGFRVVEERRGTTWGREVLEQRLERVSRGQARGCEGWGCAAAGKRGREPFRGCRRT